MDFGGHYLLGAHRLAVWEALNDADILKASIPGCQSIAWVSQTALEAEISVNLGVIKPSFTGDLELLDVEPAVSYTLSGRGRGGLLGLAHAAADVTLADHEGGTVLRFEAQGHASGRIMKLGRALIGASAQKVIDRFFERFATAMGTSVTPMNE